MSSFFDALMGQQTPLLMEHFGENAFVSVVLKGEVLADDLYAIFRNDESQPEFRDDGRAYIVQTLEMDVMKVGWEYGEIERETTAALIVINDGKYAGTSWSIRAVAKVTNSYIRLTLVNKPLTSVTTSGWRRQS